MMKEFRTLTADEIEVRVGSVSKGKASLLLYKDARCDMAILDETVGPLNWQRHHSRDNANCIVSIWDDEKKQWIEKEDTGTESNTEREKGLASDSFKRACVNLGIGRELYTSPRITINCETVQEGNRHKLKNQWQFYGCKVASIKYDDRRQITQLTIKKDDTVIYEYPDSGEHTRAIPPQPLTRDEMRDKIKALAQIKELSRAEVENKYGRPLSEFSNAELEDCLNWLKEL
jgi:hypothetical protein